MSSCMIDAFCSAIVPKKFKITHWLENFLANRVFAPMPGPRLATLFPRGACGTDTCAAWDGLCIARMGADDAGESLGVELADIAERWLSVRGCAGWVRGSNMREQSLDRSLNID